MLAASTYLQGLEDLVVQYGGHLREPPTVLVDPADTVGQYKARVYFLDGSMLSIRLLVETRLGYPRLLVYSYHYQDEEERPIFRYDNAPHHLDLPTSPDHKHIGPATRTVASDTPPSLHRVLTEILVHLERRGMTL